MGVIAKQSIRGTVVTYIGVAIGFVTTFFVLTRYLTTEEVGLSRVLVDAATLLVGLMQLGTSSSVIRFYPYFRDRKSEDHGFFGLTMLLPLAGFVVFGAAYALAHAPLSQWFGEKSPLFVDYYYPVLLIALFMLYQTVFEVNATVRMRIVFPRFVREVMTRVGLLTVYLLYARGVLSLDGFVVGFAVSYGICALLDALYLVHIGVRRIWPDWSFLMQNTALVRRYATYTGFLIISALTGILAPMVSSFFVTAKMGLDYTGIFAIATYMAVMVSIPYRSLTAIVQPELSQAIKDENRDKVRELMAKAATNLLVVGGFILLTIWVNIDLIYRVLPQGAKYASARDVVLILGVGQLMVAVFNITISALNYSRYYGWTLLLSLTYTVLCVVLNNLLITRYGIEGAAWAGMLGEAIYFGLVLLTLWLTLKTHPFSIRQLATIALYGIVFVANELLADMLPLGVVASSLVRSVVLLGGTAIVVYVARLSPEMRAMIDRRKTVSSR